MLNNEAGQNYVAVVSAALGYSRPLAVAGASFNTASSSEGGEGLVAWGALNMKMELMYPHPKVDYTVATPPPTTLPLFAANNTKKGGALHSSRKCVFLLLPWWNF